MSLFMSCYPRSVALPPPQKKTKKKSNGLQWWCLVSLRYSNGPHR